MARLSSASTESDYVPAMVPFHWESAPGRPALPEIIESHDPLPLPPGQRPKDGFYLPFPRPAQFSQFRTGAGGINSPSRDLSRLSNLKRRFRTSIRSRAHHVELQKRCRSCLEGRCLWLPRPHPDSANVRRPSKEFAQVKLSSRFMASMLLSLFPDEMDRSDEPQADDISFSQAEQWTMPRARVSSPDAIVQPPVDIPGSPTVASDERMRAWVDVPRDMSRSMSERLHNLDADQPPMANLCENCSRLLPEIHPASRRNVLTPASEPSLRRNHAEEQFEAILRPLASRPVSNLPLTSLQNHALKSSRWANLAPTADSHSEDESDDGFDIFSMKSSDNEAPDPGSVAPTPTTTPVMRCPFNPSPKPATWGICEKSLQSSSMLKHKQQRQLSFESPRSSSFLEDNPEFSTALPFPSQGAESIAEGYSAGSSLPATSKSNHGVMSRVAGWESKAGGAGSDPSGKSLPIYVIRRGGVTKITSKSVSK